MTPEEMWKQVEVSLGTRWILHGDEKAKAERDEWRANKEAIISYMAKMVTKAEDDASKKGTAVK